jgi:tetraacyldisaccharide 4'-kinase
MMASKVPRLRHHAVQRLWNDRLTATSQILWLSLVPLSAVYGAATLARAGFWRLMKRHAAVRTISVGNLTVGGNGKTPFTLFLATRMAERGLRVGIVSRGYGRSHEGRNGTLVAEGGRLFVELAEAGDEPAMMARSFDGPIAVARRRIKAIELLGRRGPLDAVVLDDALQHLALARNIDLLLVDAESGFGNGWRLPAGPMREGLGAVRRADAVVLMHRAGEAGNALGVRERIAQLAHGSVLQATLAPAALVSCGTHGWREFGLELAGRRTLAVSGLARPAAFHGMLRSLGAELVGALEYPDHHRYTDSDWEHIVEAARTAEVVVTTEKDLVKLERFAPPRDLLWALRLKVVMSAADQARLMQIVIGEAAAPSAAA